MSTLLLSLLLLLSAAPPAAALRISEEDVAREQYEEGLVREYNKNFSLYRTCNKSGDKVSLLAPLLIPELKLAFCYIPKAACSQFKDLFNHINGLPNSTRGYGHDYNGSMWNRQGVNPPDMTRENGWKYAAFTRDPALRYFSAFGDVCQVGFGADLDDANTSCCGPLVNTSSATREELIADFKARVRYDVAEGRPGIDQHWASQTAVLANCGWEVFNPENLDYWGTLSGDMNSQVNEMMQMVGYKNSTAIEMFFPPDRTAGHTSKLDDGPLDFIDDLETLEGIVKIFADDYRLLPDVGCSFTEPLLAKLRAANASGH
mmetsp:Transcript_117853/g.313513  ORF Transcript_117853/g.313513 Transcript_117853/m.313513 type:complete len:317 (-) Transcript_117853:46-996(-)